MVVNSKVFLGPSEDERVVRIVRKKPGATAPLGPASFLVEEEAFDEGDALEREIAAFVAAVSTGTAPLVTGEDGLRALEVATMINRSMAAHRAAFGLEAAGLLAAGE